MGTGLTGITTIVGLAMQLLGMGSSTASQYMSLKQQQRYLAQQEQQMKPQCPVIGQQAIQVQGPNGPVWICQETQPYGAPNN